MSRSPGKSGLAGHQPLRDRVEQRRSGCSLSEPLPGYQDNDRTECPDHKAVCDLSADADPATGLAVYDTNGEKAESGPTALA